MIIYQACCLHMTVHYDWTYKAKSTFFQILADSSGKIREWWYFLLGGIFIYNRCIFDPIPETLIKTTKFLLYPEEGLCVLYS